MTTLLVITTGQTDVQLVKDGKRHKLDGNTCGKLLNAVKQRSWSVVAPPSERSRDFVNAFSRSEGGTSVVILGIEGKPEFVGVGEQGMSAGDMPRSFESRRPIHVLPEGTVALCTPKLDAVLNHAPLLPSSVLILETTRQHEREPHLVGEVMERRLRERGVEHVTRVAYLTEDEQLEDPTNELDAVVRRPVVARLSDAIRDATGSLTQDDRVFVATTGGLPAANELINELVRLHCVGGPTVIALEVPDQNRAERDDRAVEERAVEETFHPAAGYRARWHALSLLEKGNLLGAWGAVSHLERVPGQEWTRVIKWLADFAASMPLPAECDLNVLRHPRMAVRAALRVELALRAGDIPRAVHGTVAFFEAALWDKLLEHFERSSDPKRRRFFKVKSGKAPTDDKLLKRCDGSDEDRKRPFELKDTLDGIDWYWIYDGGGGPAGRIAKYFLQSAALTKVVRALDSNDSNIRELRNDIAHSEPTPELMNEARTRMQTAGLWSSTDTCLSQPLVQDVLKDLGEEHPEILLASLLAEVRRRLVGAA